MSTHSAPGPEAGAGKRDRDTLSIGSALRPQEPQGWGAQRREGQSCISVTVKAPCSWAGFRPHGPHLQGKGFLAALQLGQEEPSIPGGPGPTPYLCLKALFTMALSTRRSPTWEGPRKWNISMAFSVGWARHRRLEEAGVGETGQMPQCFCHRPGPASPLPKMATRRTGMGKANGLRYGEHKIQEESRQGQVNGRLQCRAREVAFPTQVMRTARREWPAQGKNHSSLALWV